MTCAVGGHSLVTWTLVAGRFLVTWKLVAGRFLVTWRLVGGHLLATWRLVLWVDISLWREGLCYGWTRTCDVMTCVSPLPNLRQRLYGVRYHKSVRPAPFKSIMAMALIVLYRAHVQLCTVLAVLCPTALMDGLYSMECYRIALYNLCYVLLHWAMFCCGTHIKQNAIAGSGTVVMGRHVYI